MTEKESKMKKIIIEESSSASEIDENKGQKQPELEKEERPSFIAKLWGYMFGSSGRKAVSPEPKIKTKKSVKKTKKRVIKQDEKEIVYETPLDSK